jgi:hypothetical protein
MKMETLLPGLSGPSKCSIKRKVYSYTFILTLKKWRNLWAGGITQMVECLPSKCEVLNSNRVLPKRQKMVL